jgi:hypothetical protein
MVTEISSTKDHCQRQFSLCLAKCLGNAGSMYCPEISTLQIRFYYAGKFYIIFYDKN